MFKRKNIPSEVDKAKTYSLKKQELRRKKKLRLKILTLLFFLILIFYVLSITVLFNIENIQIKGNTVYSFQQIYELSGVKKKDNMFRLNISEISAKLKLALPYVEDVNIIRFIPETLIFEIKEAKEKSAIKIDDKYIILSEYNRILNIVDNVLPSGISLIYGINVDNVILGSYLQFDEDDKMKVLREIYDSLNVFDIKDVEYINIENLNDISIKVDNGRTVYLGNATDIEYKINMYHEINLNHLAKEEKFIINCRNPKRVVVNVDNN